MPQPLLKRVDDLFLELSVADGARISAERALADLEERMATMAQNIHVLGQVDTVLNELSIRLMNQSTSSIDKMVASGLRFVFDDVDLDFRTVVDKFRGKTSVKFILTQNGEEAPIMDSYGGGVIVVAGVLLRIVTIMTLRAKRFLLLDETLAHVSAQYVPRVSELLLKLCNELGFSILLVTHNADFAEFASTHFEARADSPSGGTVFNKVHTRGVNDGFD